MRATPGARFSCAACDDVCETPGGFSIVADDDPPESSKAIAVALVGVHCNAKPFAQLRRDIVLRFRPKGEAWSDG